MIREVTIFKDRDSDLPEDEARDNLISILDAYGIDVTRKMASGCFMKKIKWIRIGKRVKKETWVEKEIEVERSEISPETRFYKIMVICINMRKRL